MDEARQPPNPEGGAAEGALDRLVPVLTAGMTPEEAGRSREILTALLALRSTRDGGPEGFVQELAGRLRVAEGLSLEGRRRVP